MTQSIHRISTNLATLTPREREIVNYVAAGKPNKVIAIELGISQRTVEAHRARIFIKMGVRNAVELTRLLYAAGIFSLYENQALVNDTEARSV